jgi:hypothetical protein
VRTWRPEDGRLGCVWVLVFFAAAFGAYVLLHYVSPQLFTAFQGLVDRATGMLKSLGIFN